MKFFPLILDRWLAGTRMLSLEAKGAYLDLIIYLYEKRGRVIKDEAHVGRILGGIHGNKTRRIWREIAEKFVRNQYGYTHRLVSELQRNGGKVKGLSSGADHGADPGAFADSTRTSTRKEKVQKKSARFVPPEVDEVASYCAEKNYTFDPEAFVAFYESKGWRVGNQPMRSWKSACVTWTKRNGAETPAGKEDWRFDL